MSDESSSPITREYPLRCTAEHAFTYTGRIGTVWEPTGSSTRSRWPRLERFAALADPVARSARPSL